MNRRERRKMSKKSGVTKSNCYFVGHPGITKKEFRKEVNNGRYLDARKGAN